MRKFNLKSSVVICTAALLTAAPAFAGGHISAGPASGGGSVSVGAGPGGSVSLSVSNGDRTIDINSDALGAGSGASRADAATEGLEAISVQNRPAGGDGRVPSPCSLSQNEAVCD